MNSLARAVADLLSLMGRPCTVLFTLPHISCRRQLYVSMRSDTDVNACVHVRRHWQGPPGVMICSLLSQSS